MSKKDVDSKIDELLVNAQEANWGIKEEKIAEKRLIEERKDAIMNEIRRAPYYTEIMGLLEDPVLDGLCERLSASWKPVKSVNDPERKMSVLGQTIFQRKKEVPAEFPELKKTPPMSPEEFVNGFHPNFLLYCHEYDSLLTLRNFLIVLNASEHSSEKFINTCLLFAECYKKSILSTDIRRSLYRFSRDHYEDNYLSKKAVEFMLNANSNFGIGKCAVMSLETPKGVKPRHRLEIRLQPNTFWRRSFEVNVDNVIERFDSISSLQNYLAQQIVANNNKAKK